MTQARPMTDTHPLNRTPWYKQFWPWFLIVLPSAAVIASFVSLNIAMNNADSPIHESYSKQGFAIQHNAAADEIAARKNIRAAIAIDADNRIAVTLRGDLGELPAALMLQCVHTFDAHRDITIALARESGNIYAGNLPAAAYGRWKIELRPPAADWRLSGELDLQHNASLRLPL